MEKMNAKKLVLLLVLLLPFFLVSCTPEDGSPQALSGNVIGTETETSEKTPAAEDGQLEIIMLDVGQGQAILIHFPNDKWLLYDAGKRGDLLVAYLKNLGIGTLDMAVISNLDADHSAGLISAFEVINVLNFAVPNAFCDTQTCSVLLAMAEREGNGVISLSEGMTINVDPSVKMEVLNPTNLPYGRSDNDNSVVLKLTYKDFTALLPGDCEVLCEQDVMERYAKKLQSRVLVVAHHGSRTSSSEGFIEMVKPQIALVSAGAGNQYGHPAPEILLRFAEHGVRLYRTDRDGTIGIATDGRNILVETEGEMASTAE